MSLQMDRTLALKLLIEDRKDRDTASRRLSHKGRIALSDDLKEWLADDPPPHGTDAAYAAHRRAGEDACPACKIAHNEAQRMIKQRKKERATNGQEA